jgi:hypothetical protein
MPAFSGTSAWKKLNYLGFQYLDHASFSPDLALTDCYLFPARQKQF